MPIRVQCPNPKCKKSLQAPDTHAGKKARCPGCGHIITIPDPDTVLVEAGADPLLGARLGPLEIKEKLGKGGMGAVYLATNTTLDRLVAVKVLPEELVRDDPTFLDRFNREARMAAKLNHPNAVIIYSVGEDRGRHYIEMEFVQGMNLRQVIQKQGRMEMKEASRIIADAAHALAAAHKQGIVHRDIKPDNIMLTEEGQVKVADFGLARVAAADASITISGQVIGTPLYMAPEQGQGKPTDGRTDIYCLGATYYHAVTGKVPFTADTPLQVMMKHVQEPLGWPARAENIPAEIRAIIGKMMAKRPEDRYRACDEVIGAIESYFKPKPVVAQAVEVAAPIPQPRPIVTPPKNAYVVSAEDLAAIESAGRGIRHLTPTRPKKMGPKKMGTVPPSAGSSGLSPFSSISKWLLPVVGMGLVVAVVIIAVAIKGRGGPPSPGEHTQTSLGGAPGVETTKDTKKEEPTWKEPEGPQPYEQYAAGGEKASGPSEMKEDAEGFIPLFNGKDLTGWRIRDDSRPNGWSVQDGLLVNTPPSNDLITEQVFGDFEFRCEYRIPKGGNSGVYLRGRYEVQILDDFGKPASGQGAGAIYKLIQPSENASRPPEQWQSLDVKLIGKKVTVILNGRQVITDGELTGLPTGHHFLAQPLDDREDQPGPILLQGVFSSVAFRNIRIKELPAPAAPDEEAFVSLFNGKDLTGWEGDPKLWFAEAGMLIGRSQGVENTKYLATLRTYSDFVLRFRVRLVGGKGNSGMQFRSERLSPALRGVLGYQADIGEPKWGGLFDQSRRNKFLAVPDPRKVQEAVKPADWNDYEVKALGDQITVMVNGVRMIEYTETDPNIPRAGIIATQLMPREPMEVQFKDIRIKELGKEAKKPPETQIAQCGELLFEDNFDGKELKGWNTPMGALKLSDGVLLLGSEVGDRTSIKRTLRVPDFVMELAFAKVKNNPHLQLDVFARDSEHRQRAESFLIMGDCTLRGGVVENENTPVLCKRPYDRSWREFKVVFEKLGKTLALNVNGIRMTAECADAPSESGNLGISARGVLALDYIRAWKAEPKPRAEFLQPGAYDDAYVATAATGEKIPHPLSRKTYPIEHEGQKIEVPEGMVFVPAGEFIMGEGGGEHKVYLDAYFIDKYEVTNAQYLEFVKATRYQMPDHWKDNGGKIPDGRNNHPVALVGWGDAKSYADWCGKRLPTEAEWEKAARWDNEQKRSRMYPWGDEYVPAWANHCYQLGCRCSNDRKTHGTWWQEWQKSGEAQKVLPLGGGTAPVGQFPKDVSFFGCYDMGGNLMEWVNDWWREYYYEVSPNRNPPGPTEEEAKKESVGARRVFRAGAWLSAPSDLRGSCRHRVVPMARPIGFRCAADYP